MRATDLSVLAVFAPFAVLSLALPVISSLAPNLLTRHTHDRHDTSTLPRRDFRESSRCIPGTQTCVTISIAPPSTNAHQRSLFSLLEQALLAVHFHIEDYGDGVVKSGEAKWAGNDGTALRVTNANNHQLTWGVLSGAIQGVMSVMGSGAYGRASFVILDGGRQVGRGWIDA